MVWYNAQNIFFFFKIYMQIWLIVENKAVFKNYSYLCPLSWTSPYFHYSFIFFPFLFLLALYPSYLVFLDEQTSLCSFMTYSPRWLFISSNAIPLHSTASLFRYCWLFYLLLLSSYVINFSFYIVYLLWFPTKCWSIQPSSLTQPPQISLDRSLFVKSDYWRARVISRRPNIPVTHHWCNTHSKVIHSQFCASKKISRIDILLDTDSGEHPGFYCGELYWWSRQSERWNSWDLSANLPLKAIWVQLLQGVWMGFVKLWIHKLITHEWEWQYSKKIVSVHEIHI